MARSPKRSALVPVSGRRDRRSATREDLSGHHPAVAEVIGQAIDDQEDEATGQTDEMRSISSVLAKLRDDAREARRNSGIEEIWRRCEEAYHGIDESNRHEFQSMKWAKPLSPTGPVSTGRPIEGVTATRSTIYLRMTGKYVDAMYAKIAEIILAPDERAFSFGEVPDPELIDARQDKRVVRHETTGEVLTRPLMAGETPPGQPSAAPPQTPAPPGPPPGTPVPTASGPQGGIPAASPSEPPPGSTTAASPPVPGVTPPPGPGAGRVPLTVADLAEENIQLQRKQAKKAEDRIYTWMIETYFRAESRKALFDSTKLGVGVLKGPVPKIKKNMAATRDAGGVLRVIIKETIVPETVCVSPWNCYPDPACGENVQNGSHFFESDWLSEKQLRDLAEEPGYLGDAIDEIIKEGPDKIFAKRNDGQPVDPGTSQDSTRGRWQVWYFHGVLKKSELNCICQASGYVGDQSEKGDDDLIPVIATMINERIIKAVPTVLQSGKLPYRAAPWSRRAGHWAGIGVAELLFAPQRMLNAATRSMLNNAGKSAGSQIVVNQAAIRPADNRWTMTPDKFWYMTGDSVGGVGDAFQIFNIPNTTPQLMEIIKFALQIAEDTIPVGLTSGGPTGPETPETLGATQLLDSNANQQARSIGYLWDDNVTEPLVTDYYEYLLLDPDVPDEEKGSFIIDAHGSVAMVERAIQDATIAQMGPLTLNKAYGADPKRWFKQMVKSKKLDPGDFSYTPEEQHALDSQPPPEDPRVTAAKLTMQGWTDEAKIKAAGDAHKADLDHDSDMKKLVMQREIALLGYANQHKMKLTDVQAELANTAVKVQAEERLNTANNMHKRDVKVGELAADIHKHRNPPPLAPPVQAPGRARNGQAFSQTE